MSFYNSYLSIGKQPADEIKELMQEFVNEGFETSNTYWTDIEIELEKGTLEFSTIPARINRILDYKTGTYISQDFRKLLFKDLDFKPDIGTRFFFDNNVWIIYSENNTRSLTSSAYVRRCNNTINTQDKYGNIHREPCFLSENLLNNNPTEDKVLTTTKGNRILYAQHNEWTKEYFSGLRFIIGTEAYKLISYADAKREQTYDPESVKMIVAYIDIDGNNEYDIIYDKNNNYIGVADYKEFNYEIKIPSITTGVVGQMGTISNEIFLDENKITEEVVWSSNNEEIATVNETTGEYEFLKIGQCNFYCALKNNPNYFSTMVVDSVEIVDNVYENILSPSVDYITLTGEVDYEIYELLNGNKTDTEFEITCENLSKKFYELKIKDGNSFSIKNLKENLTTFLLLKCENKRDGSTVETHIELGGLF